MVVLQYVPYYVQYPVWVQYGYGARDRARTRAVEVMDVMDVIHFV